MKISLNQEEIRVLSRYRQDNSCTKIAKNLNALAERVLSFRDHKGDKNYIEFFERIQAELHELASLNIANAINALKELEDA